MKIPIVATKVGDVPEVLSYGEAGSLLESNDPMYISVHLKSFIKDEPAVKWVSDGLGSYELSDVDGEIKRGTEIVINLNDESKEFAEKFRLEQIIKTGSFVRSYGYEQIIIAVVVVIRGGCTPSQVSNQQDLRDFEDRLVTRALRIAQNE